MKKIFLILLFFSVSELFAQNGWQQITTPTNTSYTFNTIFFVTKDIGFLYYKQNYAPYSRNGVIYMTTNGGVSFFQGPGVMLTYAHFINNNTGWLIGWTETYEIPGKYYLTFKTTNAGINWSQEELFYGAPYTNCIKFANENIGWKSKINGAGFFKTTNGGATWDSVASLGNTNVSYITINPIDTASGIYRLATFNYIGGSSMYSTNSGTSWNPSNINFPIFSRPHFEFFSNGLGFIASSSVVYKSTDFGTSWNSGGSVSQIRDISAINSQHVWACDRTGNVKFSLGGSNFAQQLTTGIVSDSCSIFMFGNDLLNTTGYVNFKDKLYKTTTGGVPVTFTQNNSEIIPENFGLTVYPNPFNPSSKIRIENKYSIASLNISLYDLTGKLIRLTTYHNIATGINEFSIDYTGLPTGSYLLNISDGKLSETKKIVLIK